MHACLNQVLRYVISNEICKSRNFHQILKGTLCFKALMDDHNSLVFKKGRDCVVVLPKIFAQRNK